MATSLEGTADSRSPGEFRTLLALHAIAVDGMAQGLCVLDADLRIVLFNRRFVEMIGLPRRQVRLGTPIEELFRRNGTGGHISDVTVAEM